MTTTIRIIRTPDGDCIATLSRIPSSIGGKFVHVLADHASRWTIDTDDMMIALQVARRLLEIV